MNSNDSNIGFKKTTALFIFAKAPVAGRVKTRLAKTVGHDMAVRVQQAMLSLMVERLSALSLDVYVSADQSHPAFERIEQQYPVQFHLQVAGDLGHKMFDALDTALAEYENVIIVGGDVPAFDGRWLESILAELAHNDVVLTPAEDGGYVAIACSHTKAGMFDGIDWGSEYVLTQQSHALDKVRLAYKHTQALWDVDEERDLKGCFDDPYINASFASMAIDVKDFNFD